MKPELFMKLMHVAIDDYQAYDPEIEGIILITVKDGGATVQLGASVEPVIITGVLDRLTSHRGNFKRMPQKNKYRKAV